MIPEQRHCCSFNINFVAKNYSVGFEPSFKVFSDTFLALLSLLVFSVNDHKRLDISLLTNDAKIPFDENLKVRHNKLALPPRI